MRVAGKVLDKFYAICSKDSVVSTGWDVSCEVDELIYLSRQSQEGLKCRTRMDILRDPL